MHSGPAYTIRTPRLVMRCFEPRDAEELGRVLDANQHHLRPWVDWTQDGSRSLEARLAFVRRMRGAFDLDRDYAYAITHKDDGVIRGAATFTIGAYDGANLLGYWLAAESTGQGYATEATAALVRMAFQVHELDRVEIHCDPKNERSAHVPARLGFRHDATLRGRLRREDGVLGDRMIWSMLRDEFDASAAARTLVDAFDVLGLPILESTPAPRRSGFR
jgi:RimJ/RimL family protein N-acetyltransferase